MVTAEDEAVIELLPMCAHAPTSASLIGNSVMGLNGELRITVILGSSFLEEVAEEDLPVLLVEREELQVLRAAAGGL